MTSRFRGIFLTSEKVDSTAWFYRTVAGLALEQVGVTGTYMYWKLDQDGVQLAIHDARAFSDHTWPAQPDSNVTHLYFKIPSQPDFLAHLAQLNVTPYAVDEVVVTVVDPDGRKVLFGAA